MSGNTTVRAGQDVWIEQNFPSRNHVATVNLQVGGPSGQTGYGYIYFHQPAPRGATIKEATLRLYTRDGWGGGTHQLHVQRIATSTKFAQLTWNNRPGLTGAVVSPPAFTAANAFTLIEIDVTRHVQTMANGASNFGWRIAADDTVRRHIVSLNAGHHKPSLQVVWSDAPQAPTNLVPSGGQAVSVQWPVLSWDYVDVGGNTDLAAVQVQIAGDANSGPIWEGGGNNVHWDSGPVVADEAELDLAEAGYPGLQPDMVRYWRCRVQDGAGLWSRWSSRGVGVGAKMVRRLKGKLELLSPTGGVVDDFTPIVAWEFGRDTSGGDYANRDLAQWRIELVNPDDPTIEYWSSGRRKGERAVVDFNAGQYAFTIPQRDQDGRYILNRWGKTYRLRLDVWDHQDRATTPHDPAFVRVTHDFTLRDTPGVAAPTDLEGATDPDGRPYMWLSWHRPNTPDAWRILRGDDLIAEIPGEDLLTGTPGLYRWTDRDATPNLTHTWHVRAVEVNPTPNRDRQQSPPASWTGRIDTDHAWLVHWDSDRIVAILDPDVTFEMPDLSATYEPIARDRVVRVSGPRRGMQGSVAGRLISFPDNNPNNRLSVWRDNFIWMKAHPAERYQLMAGNKHWRVLIGDAVISPNRIPGSQAEDVSFSFWSIDGPPQP